MLKLEEKSILREIVNRKVGVFGVGQMGGALVLAFAKYLEKHRIDINEVFYLCDPSKEKKEEFAKMGYKNFTDQEDKVFKSCKILFISVKPDLVEGLIKRNRDFITSDTLIVSICAGISINIFESFLMSNKNEKMPKIIRIMANHLCLILESGSVYCVNSSCDTKDEEIVVNLLKNVGIIKKVQEKQLNVFTALSGSGPAFVYYFAESLVDAALKNGIDVATAREFAIQVIYGAGKYMKEGKEKNPSNIKYVVTTPNGTTIAGLTEFDKYKFKYAVNMAITAAAQRGVQIEKEKMKTLNKPKF